MNKDNNVKPILKIPTATSCVDPPIPGDEHFIQALYDYENHTEIPFGEEVFYRCKDGYHFGEDYYKLNFSITCREDQSGHWDEPAVWKTCALPPGWVFHFLPYFATGCNFRERGRHA